jgi:exopolysaccharide production protein ExoZ
MTPFGTSNRVLFSMLTAAPARLRGNWSNAQICAMGDTLGRWPSADLCRLNLCETRMRDSIKSIQFLRFIAASLVVFDHSALSIEQHLGSLPASIGYVAGFGGIGVHIFFVISGFIMVYTSFSKEGRPYDAQRFFLRRFIRIFPIYWIYAFLYLVVHQAILNGYLLSVRDTIYSLLLLPGYSPLIIGPGWTLSYELYFYLCFGIFMMLGLLLGLTAMSLFFLLSITGGFALSNGGEFFHLATSTLLLEFLAGAWIAYFFVSGIRLSKISADILLLSAVAAFLASLGYGYHRLPSMLSWGIPSALLITGSVFRERTTGVARPVQRFSFLGDSSYSLYLLHLLVIDLLITAALPLYRVSMAANVAFCLSLIPVCIIVAHLSFRFIESRLVGALRFNTQNLLILKAKKSVS